ncbi:T9SS type A sorting domain-containing protein [Adhaeribacter aquaticus]|uniref:T9SS type A sorting domain-containing protein n=1 Tax=Adhaeribacter aquaticus TaxID=299567 RepID=UPI000408F735|nr:T9SS type A sorting domain-containing protein [Adhaeribacter aquaticus]
MHPPVKKPVGIRTASGARGSVFGENIPYSGPIRDTPNSYANAEPTAAVESQDIVIYPNPAPGGQFRISTGNLKATDKVSERVSDLAGKVVYNKEESAGGAVLVNSSLNPGVYMVEVKNNATILSQKQVIIK